MQRLLSILVGLVVVGLISCGAAGAQEPLPQPDESSDRMFFPRDTLYGYAQFDLAPPHNEIDPNLCAATAGNFGGVTPLAVNSPATCSPVCSKSALSDEAFSGALNSLENLGSCSVRISRRRSTPGRSTPSGSSIPGAPEFTSAKASRCESRSTSCSID